MCRRRAFAPPAGLLFPSEAPLRVRLEKLRTQSGRAWLIVAAGGRPRFVNGAAETGSVKKEKRAAVKRPPGIRRDQMIAFPGCVFPGEHLQNILPLFFFPPPEIFVRHISRKIGQTTTPAAQALQFYFLFHGSTASVTGAARGQSPGDPVWSAKNRTGRHFAQNAPRKQAGNPEGALTPLFLLQCPVQCRAGLQSRVGIDPDLHLHDFISYP